MLHLSKKIRRNAQKIRQIKKAVVYTALANKKYEIFIHFNLPRRLWPLLLYILLLSSPVSNLIQNRICNDFLPKVWNQPLLLPIVPLLIFQTGKYVLKQQQLPLKKYYGQTYNLGNLVYPKWF